VDPRRREDNHSTSASRYEGSRSRSSQRPPAARPPRYEQSFSWRSPFKTRVLPPPYRVQRSEVPEEWVLVLAPPQQAATGYLRKAAVSPPLTERSKPLDELAPRIRTAAGRYTIQASSRNRARRRARGSRRSDRSERGTSGQKNTPARRCLEPQPSRHYGASPYRNPFCVGSDQTGEGARSIYDRVPAPRNLAQRLTSR